MLLSDSCEQRVWVSDEAAVHGSTSLTPGNHLFSVCVHWRAPVAIPSHSCFEVAAVGVDGYGVVGGTHLSSHWSPFGLFVWLRSLIGIKAVWPHVEVSMRRAVMTWLNCVAVWLLPTFYNTHRRDCTEELRSLNNISDWITIEYIYHSIFLFWYSDCLAERYCNKHFMLSMDKIAVCNVKEVHTDLSMCYHSAVYTVFSQKVININSTYCTCSAPEDRLAKLAANIS